MIIIQIIYVIIGIFGILSYLSSGKFLTLNLATMLIVGGILSFIFSTWWWFLAPLFDVLIIRPIVFMKQDKKTIYKWKIKCFGQFLKGHSVRP